MGNAVKFWPQNSYWL